jgi:hypothetical protein
MLLQVLHVEEMADVDLVRLDDVEQVLHYQVVVFTNIVHVEDKLEKLVDLLGGV